MSSTICVFFKNACPQEQKTKQSQQLFEILCFLQCKKPQKVRKNQKTNMQIAIASQKKFHVSKKNAYKKNAFLGGKISIENRLLENALVFF